MKLVKIDDKNNSSPRVLFINPDQVTLVAAKPDGSGTRIFFSGASPEDQKPVLVTLAVDEVVKALTS